MKAPYVVAIASCLSCAPQQANVLPVTAAPVTTTVAPYAQPSAPVRGEVRVTSWGLVDIQASAGAARLRAWHVRTTLRNGDDRVWTLDARDQRLALGGHGRSTPAFAASDPGVVLPVVSVAPGASANVDLFYPLPDDLQIASAMPSASAISWINVGEEVAVQRTPIEHVEHGAEPWAPPYWYNAFYPDFSFVGAAELPAALVGKSIVIRRVP